MLGQPINTILLKDGRQAEISHVVAGDAAANLRYVDAISVETDFSTFAPGEFGMSLEQEVAFIESLADGSKGIMLKATVDGAIVGNAILTRSPRSRIRHVGELGLSVLKEFWSSGLGRALCQALFAEGKRLGVERIALRVRADNARAIHLYESLGFKHEGRLVGAFRVGGTSYDELVMGLLI